MPLPVVAARRLLLVAGAILVALALVAVAEAALRLAGFGGPSPMLRRLDLPPPVAGVPDGSALYEIHPRVAELFFSRRGPHGAEFVGGHRRELVVLPKPPGTLRIVLVGASTIEGFPHARHLTAARFLEAMLRHVLPGRRVEVLNLGVTAIASFPVRTLAIAAMDELDPDVVVVYEAHNEFFGAAGVASRQFLGRTPTTMTLAYRIRELALFQGLQAVAPPPPRGEKAPSEHLIEVMAAVPPVPPGADLHGDARRSLIGNFRAVVRAGRDRHIPVVLTTVASLERDLVPIASDTSELPPARRAAFAAELARLRDALVTHDGTVQAPLAALVEEAPHHAEAVYWLGRALEVAGSGQQAAELFRRARDLDAMPWRASRDKNVALRELAVQENVPLADCEVAFAAASQRGGSPGATTWDLFSDHVHPSLEGQALLARTILDTLIRDRVVAADASRLETIPPSRRLAETLGVNALELYAVEHKMATLFRAPPFAEHNREAAVRAEERLAGFRERSGPVERAAVKLWEEGSREAGFALPISWFGGVVALRIGDFARARHFLLSAESAALQWSDERAAATLLRQLATVGEADTGTLRRHMAKARREAEQTAALAAEPGALLTRVLACHRALAGDRDAAASLAAESQRLAPSAPAWERVLLAGVPDPLALARVERNYRAPAADAAAADDARETADGSEAPAASAAPLRR